MEFKNSTKKDETTSDDRLLNNGTPSLDIKNKFEDKKPDDNKFTKKTSNKDTFKGNTKKVTLNKGYEKKKRR